MKKSLIAAALAASLLLSGCSGVSQEEYNSLVEENAGLQEENGSLKEQQDTSLESSSNDSNVEKSTENLEDDEYCMPKDHVKRVAKVLEQPESKRTQYQIIGLDMNQYNIKSTVSCEVYYDNGDCQIKSICDISTDNSFQEKAAFIYYFFRLHMGEYIEREIENGCENVVTVINDNNGEPIAVWLVYKKDGKIKHDMDVVDVDVLNAIEEVSLDRNTWQPKEDQQTYPLPETSIPENDTFSTSQSSTPTVVTSTPAATESQTPPTQSSATMGEINALKKAQSYLKNSAFSRDGLIEQLEYNGYTNSEAVYGADNAGADWNEQALKKALSYLSHNSFSYDGLVEQLEYNKFTHEQAVYGADRCGADWNEQALNKAISYLSHSALSYDGIVEQLEYNKFTHEQAIYGADKCGADWNEQASKKAESYLSHSSFSRSSLIEQLEYNGFTHEQAVYGATANGY